ncbi:MAG: NYN domain-containing protein [Pseudomonadota bacterium]
MAQVRLAVLIDADNAQSELIAPLLAEIARYGTATTRRIYGDWTKPHLASWKEKLLQHAIQPIQQFAYTSGKNATDSALIIDAMDLLYSGRFEGFCLVSSDSDFTRLASRLRESGLLVYGFGEQKTPKPLVAACDKFTYVEVLREPATVADAVPATKPKLDGKLHKLLDAAFNASVGEGDWVHLGTMGSQLSKQSPDFDARNYGHKRLSDLVRATSRFELEERKGPDGKSLSHYLRRK